MERFSLNDSVTDLLRVNPRNLAFRTEVTSGLRQLKEKGYEIDSFQQREGITPYQPEYLPKDTPLSLKEFLAERNEVLYGRRPSHVALRSMVTEFQARVSKRLFVKVATPLTKYIVLSGCGVEGLVSMYCGPESNAGRRFALRAFCTGPFKSVLTLFAAS